MQNGNSKTITLSGPTSAVTVLSWSPDGTRIAASSGAVDSTDYNVRVWDRTGMLLATLQGHSGPVTSLSWSPDGRTLASGSIDATVRLWTASGNLLLTLKTSSDPVFNVAWSPDGKTLATGAIALRSPGTPGTVPGLPGIVRLWRADGQLLNTLSTQYTGGKFLDLAWSPDSTLLAAGASDFRLWHADGTSAATLRERGTPAWAMAWSPDSRTLAIGDEDGTIAVYTTTGGMLAHLKLNYPVPSVSFSPDSETLAVMSAVSVQLYDIKVPNSTPRIVYQLQSSAETWSTSNVSWSSDGSRIAASPQDHILRVWSKDGTLLSALGGCGDMIGVVSWSPAGGILAGGSRDGKVCLWQSG